RIALDVSRSNPNVVYAQIEAGEVGKPEPTPGRDVEAATEATPPGAAAVNPPAGRAGQAGRAGRAGTEAAPPSSAAEAQAGGRGGPTFDWCDNGGPNKGFVPARGAPPNTPPPAGWKPPQLDPQKTGLFRSDNKGQSWTAVSNCDARPMYFSQLRIDPTTDRTIYVAGLPVAKSLDGGRTFATLDDEGG